MIETRFIKSSTGLVHIEGRQGHGVCSGNRIKGASYVTLNTHKVTCKKCGQYVAAEHRA